MAKQIVKKTRHIMAINLFYLHFARFSFGKKNRNKKKTCHEDNVTLASQYHPPLKTDHLPFLRRS